MNDGDKKMDSLLKNKLDEVFKKESDKMKFDNVGSIEDIIKESFIRNNEKIICVKDIRIIYDYSNVRINNIMLKLLKDNFVVRSRIKGIYYYKLKK